MGEIIAESISRRYMENYFFVQCKSVFHCKYFLWIYFHVWTMNVFMLVQKLIIGGWLQQLFIIGELIHGYVIDTWSLGAVAISDIPPKTHLKLKFGEI